MSRRVAADLFKCGEAAQVAVKEPTLRRICRRCGGGPGVAVAEERLRRTGQLCRNLCLRYGEVSGVAVDQAPLRWLMARTVMEKRVSLRLGRPTVHYSAGECRPQGPNTIRPAEIRPVATREIHIAIRASDPQAAQVP